MTEENQFAIDEALTAELINGSVDRWYVGVCKLTGTDSAILVVGENGHPLGEVEYDGDLEETMNEVNELISDEHNEL